MQAKGYRRLVDKDLHHMYFWIYSQAVIKENNNNKHFPGFVSFPVSILLSILVL